MYEYAILSSVFTSTFDIYSGELISFNFLQKFDIWPIILRVDYCPSRVDLAALSGGKYVELVNLVPWKVIFCYVYCVDNLILVDGI